MIFTKDLEELIFQRHEIIAQVDKLTVLSGYIGPSPVQRLAELPFPAKVIYGMYGSEGINATLHNTLLEVHNSTKHVDIYYSQMPIHAKSYTWHAGKNIVHALIGSANFSTNGLRSPHREILAEITRDSFTGLGEYIDKVMNSSISCLEAEVSLQAEKSFSPSSECFLLLVGRDGEVQDYAGLNWGQNPKNHTNISDAYIPITTQDIRNFPNLFPPKQTKPIHFDDRGRESRDNDSIEIVWDDGKNMEGLLMGSQTIGGIKYPKQISAFPSAQEMGLYFRQRLGVPPKDPVRRHHLDRYGRTDVQVSLIGEGVYYFDFARKSK